jgi:hypothetical protein
MDDQEREALLDRLVGHGRAWAVDSRKAQSKEFNKLVLGYVILGAILSGVIGVPILVFIETLIGGLTHTSDWVISPMAIPLCLIAVLITWWCCHVNFEKLMGYRLSELEHKQRTAALLFYDLDKLGIDTEDLGK